MNDQTIIGKSTDVTQKRIGTNTEENMDQTNVGNADGSNTTGEKQNVKNTRESDKKSENNGQDKKDTSKHSSISSSKENGSSSSKPTTDKTNENSKGGSKQADEKKTEARKDRKRDRSGSKSKSTRDGSPSRSSAGRTRRYETGPKGRIQHRGRSRTPVRRRTRSPVPRRPSPFRYHREPRRWSPRRRSRSPRSRRSPGRSEKNSDSKVLKAKKSFLDDLAVQFAQEGKEFPELEQYRCAINEQFVSYPARNSFPMDAMQQNFAGTPTMPAMFTNAPQMEIPGNNAVVLTDPYNAYSYNYPGPIPNSAMGSYLPPAMNSYNSQESVMPQQQLPEIQRMREDSPMKQKPVSEIGSHSFYSFDKADKSKVLIRITQARQILEDLDLSITRSAKFMFRAPTLYNNANQDRSPMCSLRNPLFAFTKRLGENTDPFANVPRKLKLTINKLGLDEGVISEQIFRRQSTANIGNHRQKIQQNDKRQHMATLPKSQALPQKTAQSGSSGCVECVRRKTQSNNNNKKQTIAVRTTNSSVQTDPMAVPTVTEFGSITELTPNQVRAVSELIRYIKLTATSGTLQEMRDSMQEDQVYNLNSDLHTAYQYFDEMVESRNEIADMPSDQHDQPLDANDDSREVDDDGNPIDEYEQFHRNFCESDEDDMSGSAGLQSTSKQHQYMHNESIDSKYSQQRSYGFGNDVGGVHSGYQFRSNEGTIPANNRGQQRGGHGRGNFNSKGIGPNIYNRRN